MALTFDRHSLRLFGIDLAAAPAYLREGWADALRWPALRWLTPDEPVRVIHADGSESVRQGVSARRIAAPPRVRFVAVELPEDDLLRRTLVLPRLSEADLRQAVELDVNAASPFPPEDLAWGHEVDSGEGVRIDIALTSKPLIARRLELLKPRLGDAVPEVWAGGERPIVIPGYGEVARQARRRRLRLALFGLLAVTGLLLGALAVTPTLQLRERALDAIGRHEALEREVQPQAQMREELARIGEQVALLTRATEKRLDVVALIEEVTRQLPDDAWLTRLEISSDTVRIAGMADNAAQLLQTLGTIPAFRDVRAPGGISKAPAGGKEGFTIEFRFGEGKAP
jgi:general secretion pathway protein L